MQRFFDVVRHRMGADFRIGIYLAFGALSVLILLPIALIRLVQGQVPLAVVDFAIITFITAAVAHAWRGGNLDHLGTIVAVVMTAGGCVVTGLSHGGVYWMFPITMASFFLAKPHLSLSLFGLMAVWLLFEGEALASTGQPLAALAALTVNAAFALVFARYAGKKRSQLEQLATLDALTGAENRRALETALEIAIVGFRRDGRSVALALIDLDHFKRVNDRFGHDVGDVVLQDFVRLVQASVRRTDRLYRYGGEEFVLLMPATDELGLELAMSHLRAQIRQGLMVRGEPITVSIGGAILRPGESRDAWFGRADEALYRAKDSGRNRLEIDISP